MLYGIYDFITSNFETLAYSALIAILGVIEVFELRAEKYRAEADEYELSNDIWYGEKKAADDFSKFMDKLDGIETK